MFVYSSLFSLTFAFGDVLGLFEDRADITYFFPMWHDYSGMMTFLQSYDFFVSGVRGH